MQEIYRNLPENARILDLGCAAGSFPANALRALTVRVDIAPVNASQDAHIVQGDAAHLPFASGVFDTIVCNHSLEHFHDLRFSLIEIGRVLKSNGSLFVSVPDVNTICDRIYRWLARGGGHVNEFRSAEELAGMISHLSSVPHVATTTLCTSFSFMNRKNPHPRQPRKMALFLWGAESFLILFNAFLRLFDRCFQSRASVYGWALYFGNVGERISERACVNVCVRCGQGHPSAWLESLGAVRGFLVKFYRCPACRTINFFMHDEAYAHLWHERRAA